MSYWMDNGRLGVEVDVYENEDARTFIEDCEIAGLHPFHYEGRNFWQGPAVICGSFGEFQTSVRVQHDNMGMDYVVYPVSRASLVSETPKDELELEDEEEQQRRDEKNGLYADKIDIAN